jgi:hypothetical protein
MSTHEYSVVKIVPALCKVRHLIGLRRVLGHTYVGVCGRVSACVRVISRFYPCL